MKIIIFILISLIINAKMIKNNDIVIDTTNKLIWQDNKDNIYNRVSQNEAIKYCKKLPNGLWRLPSISEYKTILDLNRAKTDEISLNKIFKYVIKDDYWTSDRTWIRNFGRYGYYLKIRSGFFYYDNRKYKKFIRCVKDLKVP